MHVRCTGLYGTNLDSLKARKEMSAVFPNGTWKKAVENEMDAKKKRNENVSANVGERMCPSNTEKRSRQWVVYRTQM